MISLDQLSDMELVALTRDQNPNAYGVLWRRHSGPGHALARSFTSFDADDVVGEAFTRVLASIRNGYGPTAGFRSYLLATVKNVARDWGRKDALTDSTPDLELMVDPDVPASEDAAIAALENSVTATAFRSLPTRWQEALWYSEIEELKPRQFAPLLGIAPNAASALVVRAKKGLRDAWIAGQLKKASSPECQDVLSQLGAHTRGALSASVSAEINAHLEECDPCTIAWDEAGSVASRLAFVILPITVGVAGAAAYTAWVQTGGPAASADAAEAGEAFSSSAAVSTGALSSSVLSSAALSSGAHVAVRSRRLGPIIVASTAGAVSIVLAAVIAASAFSTPATVTAEPLQSAASFSERFSNDGAAPDVPVVIAPVIPTQAAPLPPVVQPVVNTPTVRQTTTIDVPQLPADLVPPASTGPGDNPIPPTGTESGTGAGLAGGTEPADGDNTGTGDVPGSGDSGPGAGSGDPGSGDSSPTDPAPVTPDAPAFTVDESAGAFFYPELLGTAAEPSAQIEVVDETGTVVASTTADASGAWSVDDFSGSECATDAAAYLQPGSHQLQVRQSVNGLSSPLSSAQPIAVGAPPAFVSPLSGGTVSQSSLVLDFTGQAGTQVQRIKTPDPDPCREAPMTIDSSGEWAGSFTVPDTGPITIGLRYIDPATGRHGPAAFITVAAK